MKFSHLKAFEKHVESADPKHLSDIYLIVDPEEYVQKNLAKKLVTEEQSLEEYIADEMSVATFNGAVNSFSMFAKSTCLILYRADKAQSALLKKILEYCSAPQPHIRLVLCASSMQKDFVALNKQAVILDLASEKPWDRDKRLSLGIQEKLWRHKVRISASLADQIAKMSASKVAVIDQEIEKLVCYLNGKSEVSRADLSLLGSNYQYSIFKVGQALLENQLRDAIRIIEAEKFPLILLIYSLRSVVQRSYRLKGLSPKECSEYFPKLRGSFLEKNMRLSRMHSGKALKAMIQTLFETELLMKSQSESESFLAALLIMKIGALSESISV